MKAIAIVEWADMHDTDIVGTETIPFEFNKNLTSLIEKQMRLDMTKKGRAILSINYITPKEWFDEYHLELCNMIKDDVHINIK